MLPSLIAAGVGLPAQTFVNGHDGTGRDRSQAADRRATPDFVQIMQDDAETTEEPLPAPEDLDIPMDLPLDILAGNDDKVADAAAKIHGHNLLADTPKDGMPPLDRGAVVDGTVDADGPRALLPEAAPARPTEHETHAVSRTIGTDDKASPLPERAAPTPGQSQDNGLPRGFASSQPTESAPLRSESRFPSGEAPAEGTRVHVRGIGAVASSSAPSAARDGPSGTDGRGNASLPPSPPRESMATAITRPPLATQASDPPQPATPVPFATYPSHPFTTETAGTDFPALASEGDDTTLRLDLRGTASGALVSGPVSQPVLLRQDLPQHLAMQIVSAVQKGRHDRPVQLLLNPAELGQVRISLSASDGTVNVTVIAERPETLDLMRRHIGALAQEFQDIGYERAQFSFGDGHSAPSGQKTPDHRDPDRDQNAMPGHTLIVLPLDTTAPLISDRLDLRL